MSANFNTPNIAVLFGGRSSEHEISLRSAIYILQNIPSNYNIIPVGISRDGRLFSLTGIFSNKDFQNFSIKNCEEIIDAKVPEQFPNSLNRESIFLPLRTEVLEPSNAGALDYRILNHEISCVFPVLHGQNGEDGRWQGLFELAELAYIGCDMRASLIGMDKDLQKRLASAAGIDIARYQLIDDRAYHIDRQKIQKKISKEISFPCFVKPNSLGSAIGANKAHNIEELEQYLLQAFKFDNKVLVEEFITGTEVECAFLDNNDSKIITCAGEIVNKNFYSYHEKYSINSEASLYIPARLSNARMTILKDLAMRVIEVMGIFGCARVDFWNVREKEKFIFNEYNSIPGMTSISMFPKLLEYEGIIGSKWIDTLIQDAYNRKNRLARLSVQL